MKELLKLNRSVRGNKCKLINKTAFIVAVLMVVIQIFIPLNTKAASFAVQPFTSSLYDEEVDYKYIKYGYLEVRNHDVKKSEVNLTYYTHYSLNMRSKLKSAVFQLAVDEDLKDHILDVRVRTGKKSWTSAKPLKNGTYAINHSDVLRTGLIGVNQQFDIKILLNNKIQNLNDDIYTADIALFDKKNRVVVNTVDSTFFETVDKGIVSEKNNLVTGSGYTVSNKNPNDTEITLNYMMHYKLNAAKHKRGQFKFSFDKKLIPYITDVQVKTRDGKFKSVVYNKGGKFSYSTKNLVSHALIGIRQNFSVKIKLKETVAQLPSGIYLFDVYQTTGDGKKILDGTNNSTYFIK